MGDLLKLDLSYLQDMLDEELFAELGDAEWEWIYESSYHNYKVLQIVNEAKKELRKRGYKFGDHKDIQFVPLTNELLNTL